MFPWLPWLEVWEGSETLNIAGDFDSFGSLIIESCLFQLHETLLSSIHVLMHSYILLYMTMWEMLCKENLCILNNKCSNRETSMVPSLLSCQENIMHGSLTHSGSRQQLLLTEYLLRVLSVSGSKSWSSNCNQEPETNTSKVSSTTYQMMYLYRYM